MKDAEIINIAKDCCSENPQCFRCPFDEDTITADECMGKLVDELQHKLSSCNSENAELKAEIERLDALWNSAQDNNFNILGLLFKMRKELKTAKEDNERHKAEVKWWRSQIRDTEDLLAEFDRPIVEVRNEAIKEFAKRLKEPYKDYDKNVGVVGKTTLFNHIDDLVKDLTEDK